MSRVRPMHIEIHKKITIFVTVTVLGKRLVVYNHWTGMVEWTGGLD